MVSAAQVAPEATFGRATPFDPATSDDRLSLRTFSQLFLCALALKGRRRIEFGSPRDTMGIARIITLVSTEIDRMRSTPKESTSQLYYDLVSIRNQLQQSDSGAYDGFEELVSSQQSWLASKFNPTLTKVSIDVGEGTAVHLMKKQPAAISAFVEAVAEEFISTD